MKRGGAVRPRRSYRAGRGDLEVTARRRSKSGAADYEPDTDEFNRPAMVLNTSLTLVPVACIATTAASAISAASSAYSIRSWPSSSRSQRAAAFSMRFIGTLLVKRRAGRANAPPGQVTTAELRTGDRRIQPAGDRVEHAVDARAGRLHRHDRRQRDQRREQRVLDQVLPVFRLEKLDHLIHGPCLLRASSHDAPCRVCEIRPPYVPGGRVTSGHSATAMPDARIARTDECNLRRHTRLARALTDRAWRAAPAPARRV